MTPKLKRILLYGGLFISGAIFGAIVCCVILVYSVFGEFFNNPFNDEKFDQKIWLKYHNSDEFDNPRGKMAEDLRNKILKAEMNRQEILNLLGPPDFREEKDLLSYNLGMWSGFRMDGDSFDVYLDSSGRVKEILIVQH